MAEPLDVQDLAERATAAAQQWSRGSVVEDVTFLPGGTVSLVYTANVRRRARCGASRPEGGATGLPPVRNRDVFARLAPSTRCEPGAGGRRPGGALQ